MRNKQKIKDKFPAVVEITTTMIKTADLFDERNCLGAMALRKVTKLKKGEICWSDNYGFILAINDLQHTIRSYSVRGNKTVNMMEIKRPRKVLLKFEKYYEEEA